MNRESITKDVAKHLLSEGIPPTEAIDLAHELMEITLPEGAYGFCSMDECRNPATNDIGLPVCKAHEEVVDYGAAWDTARTDAEMAWGVKITDGWIEEVEAVIRDRVADEFRVLAEVPDRSPVARMTYLDAARIAQGDHSAT